ncbi:MAG: hypothetical protein JXB49_35820 [Bacteroidales bacterium]|nr:hypothetical protein [Bacteroidales bacterium]
MNYNEPIKFQQERDFGQVFNSTFAFIKQEYKKLGNIFIRYCTPLILLSAIATTLYQHRMLGFELNPYSSNPFGALEGLVGIILLMAVLAAASHAMIACTIFSYISLYSTKGSEGFEAEDVWQKISENYFKVFGTVVLAFIIIMAGTVFCVLPGIYLGVSLCFILIIVVHEKKSFGDAFSRSFELSHERWWWTLLLIIVIGIIMAVIGLLISLPSTIITMSSALHNIQSGEYSQNQNIIITATSAVSSIASQILKVIPLVAYAFQYFAIVESKEKPSLMNQIDQIS